MNDFWNKIEKLYENKYGNSKDNEELSKLEEVLEKIGKELEEQYEFIEPKDIGGAGIVIRIKDKKLDLDRALKTPRPKKEIADLMDSFRSEIEHLNQVRHKNIITIQTFGEVEVSGFDFSYPYFVMDYIEEAKDLTEKISDILAGATRKDIKIKMKFAVDKFYKIAEAVKFLHDEHNIIHFDIKPSNILIGKNDEPILTDLGFARKKSDKESCQAVGFTLFYAHPDLRLAYSNMSTKNRVRTERAPKDFKYAWDIYAFGKSLLEILSQIDGAFPDIVVYDYFFVYLHLAACRMFDARNLPDDEIERTRSEQTKRSERLLAYKETWLELGSQDFKQINYKTFAEICQDFEKLSKGQEYLAELVPELSMFYPKRVVISEGSPPSFSERVRYIIEHPVFSRLINVPQLGLVNTVYPTATHTRAEHSIGTFRNCCLYVQSLWNDPYNPLFKQLVNEKDIRALLVASLVHDLGHYPLAHDIEEIARELRHEEFTLQFLDNPTEDKFQHTLQHVIENEEWGWAVPLGHVKKILKGEERWRLQKPFLTDDLKLKMLSSIIDSPIDVDKLDYLVRDSRECYLPYGRCIDEDRLIRNLTVIITEDRDITIGTYEKGQSSAESLAFTRYLMYQSVYCHHTVRAIRAMLSEATKAADKALRQRKGRMSRKGTTSFSDELKKLLGVTTKEAPNRTVNDILDLIEKYTDEEGKEMIRLIRQRNYYKRILTIHSYPSDARGRESPLDEFRNACRSEIFQKRLQEEIERKFLDRLSFFGEHTRVSSLAREKTDETLKILATPKKIICDCPDAIYGSNKVLRFIPEPQRLQRNYLTRRKTGDRNSEVWSQAYFGLMNIASKGRVFCHPAIRDSLMAALDADGVRACVETAIKECRRQL